MTILSFLILRLDGPLQSWGTVARDPLRPTGDHPSRSGLAGMLASALGHTYADGAETTALQRSLRYAVREDRPARRVRDYQTADLERIGREAWTRFGLERRGGGSAASGTHVLEKDYLADASFTVALTLREGAATTMDALEQALRRPARPLFLGRRGCLPASPILAGRLAAPSPWSALKRWPLEDERRLGSRTKLRCWYEDGDGPPQGRPHRVWDQRNFTTDRFTGARIVREFRLDVADIRTGDG